MTTKSITAMEALTTLTAGAGDHTSAGVAVTSGYGAEVHVELVNGSVGPTIPAQVQIQVSPDNTNWYDFGSPLIGSPEHSIVDGFPSIEVPIGVKYVRAVSGSNTAQNVTLNIQVSEATVL